MIPLIRWNVFIGILVALPAFGVAQTAKTQPAVDLDKVRAKLLTGPFIEGQLTVLAAEEKRFQLRHVHQVKTPNADVQTKLKLLTAQFNAALLRRSTSLDELRKMQADGMALEKIAYQVAEYPILFTLQGDKNLVVRTLLPPVDAKGNPLRLTPAEKQKLIGNPRYPGYQAAIQDLNARPTVQVYLDRSKLKPAADTKPEEAVYPLTMIVIVPEPQPVSAFRIPGE